MPSPTEQLLARTVYTTDGVTVNWDFSFAGGYIDPSHVKAYTETALGQRTIITVTPDMLIGEFQLRIIPTLAAGLTLTIYRETPKDLPIVDFTDEAGFSEIALDTNAKQAVFIAAEVVDVLNTTDVGDAAVSAAAAAASAAEAADTLNDFEDMYLGAHPVDPVLTNNGGPLIEGSMYWNSTVGELRVYTSGAWDVASIPGVTLTNAVTETFSGDGIETEFVLTNDAGLVSNLDLSVGGITQIPGINFSYTALTKTITFLTGAPPIGTNNICARYGNTFVVATTQPYGGVTIPNFTMTAATPDMRVPFPSTSPAAWNVGPGRKTVDFEFLSTSFFAANPGAHVAIVTRCDTSNLAVRHPGAGVIFGDMTWSGFNGDEAKFEPTTQLESWSIPNVPLQRFIWPESTGPRNAVLADGVRYRMIIETTVQPNTAGVYMRYRLYRQAQPVTKLAWDLLVDTGDVLDYSNVSDMTQQGLVFGAVFLDNLSAWALDFQNIKVTWGPCGNVINDNSACLSKYGAELAGDMNIHGLARRHRFATVGGPSLTDAYTFQSLTVNGATTLVMKPNGTSTNAGTLYSNNSSSATTYQALVVGMNGADGLLETFGYAAGNPNLGVNIGAANRVATFKPTGLNMLGGSKDIGQLIGWSAGLTNWGGPNATTLSTTGTLDMDNFCLPAYIKNFLITYYGVPTNTADGIEVAIRPLYSMFSYLVKNLQDKKVI